jgi:hypothetical protein
MTHEQLLRKVGDLVLQHDGYFGNPDDTARAILALVAGELREPSDGMLLAIMDAKQALATVNVYGMSQAEIMRMEARRLLSAALAASPLGGSLAEKGFTPVEN